MKTAFELPERDYETGDADFLARIREHGWTATHVFGDGEGSGFTYTTGFYHSVGQPEFLYALELKHDVANGLNWDIWRRIEADGSLPIGVPVDRLIRDPYRLIFLPMRRDAYKGYVNWSLWFYRGEDFPCLQAVFPDKAGLFPWESGYDPATGGDQPDLTDGNWAGRRA
ncbi:MAG: DUF4262 domain-containing protein [Pseudomonadota bacterium]